MNIVHSVHTLFTKRCARDTCTYNVKSLYIQLYTASMILILSCVEYHTGVTSIHTYEGWAWLQAEIESSCIIDHRTAIK